MSTIRAKHWLRSEVEMPSCARRGIVDLVCPFTDFGGARILAPTSVEAAGSLLSAQRCELGNLFRLASIRGVGVRHDWHVSFFFAGQDLNLVHGKR
jgi:hypothetical protein